MRSVLLLLCVGFIFFTASAANAARSYKVLVRLSTSQNADDAEVTPVSLTKDSSSAATSTVAPDCTHPEANTAAAACNAGNNSSTKEFVVQEGANVMLWNGIYSDGVATDAALHATVSVRGSAVSIRAHGDSGVTAMVDKVKNVLRTNMGKWNQICMVRSLDKTKNEGTQYLFVKVLPIR